MNLKKLILTALVVFSLPFMLISAITVNINSGNPKMPFPQFLDYYGGTKSLASEMPDGVTHAEMELWIREAWKIHSNEFNYTGTVTYGAQTVNLIRDSSTPYCSEGHGYALLAAALMADKDAFDGLWFYLNENGYFNKTLTYSTGVMNNAGYKYGKHAPAVYGAGGDSAFDGDVDIALAALIAWKQWGDNTGYYAPGGTGAAGPGGNMIQYRQMALDMIKFLVQKDEGDNIADNYWTSGGIGFDGYPKSGNTFGESTTWANCPGASPDCPTGPQFGGSTDQYFDYIGPSYLRCFSTVMSGEGLAWESNQFRRSAASTAWLMGRLAATNAFTHAGKYTVNNDGSVTTFTNVMMAEDMRAPWRHGLDYLWYGNPTETWNPVTHQPVAGANTYELNGANKFSSFLKNNVACKSYGSSPITYDGTAGALSYYTVGGAAGTAFHLNWIFGAGSPAVVASQDYEQMGEFFRELMILWDGSAGYLTSVPVYFHGFFRQLGLMILTGNHPSPCDIQATANMKVYKAVNKTYSFAGDTITYWINYRNYGSLNAANVFVRDTLPAELDFVSSVPAATALGGNAYEWNIGTVNGLANQNYNATMGGITLVARVKTTAAMGKFCNTADVRCSNGSGWRSNDLPNNVTDVMERNCVDVVAAALQISKTADVYSVNPGDTITYTVQYCNSAEAGWINGGRSGVNFSFAVDAVPGNVSTLTFYLRANHAAAEPVINWKNYRMSYFINSSYTGAAWNVDLDYVAGFPVGSQSVSFENLVAGSDAIGAWNQRIMLQFGNATNIPTHHLFNYTGVPGMIHQGSTLEPFIIKGRIHAANNAQDWTDDWSQQGAASIGSQSDPLWPITPDWTKGDGTSVPVTKINKHACQTAANSIDNILIEEWDGYTWRRVFGNGPQPGRQLTNVIVKDSLPTQVTFGGWAGTAGTRSGRDLEWTTPSMLVSECQTRKYWVTANTIGCPAADVYADNIAFVSADNEFPVSDAVRVTITCATLPTPTPFPVSLTKTANLATYSSGNAITYTINYTNKYGSVVSDPLNANTNWTKQSGSADLTFGAGRAQSQAGTAVRTHNLSHGTNGQIIARLHVEKYATFGIALRHTGGAVGNGYYVTFKPNFDSTANIVVWNGTTSLCTYANVNVGNPADFDVKLDLQGTALRIYIDPTRTQTWPALPTAGPCTLPSAVAGYAGLINGDPTGGDAFNSGHYASLWIAQLDTSINTSVFDTIPAGVTYVGGDNAAANVSGVVVWPTIALMNYNTALTYKWWGTVSGSCVNITNTARVLPLGILTPIIAATVVNVSCGATTPTFTPTASGTFTYTLTRTMTMTPSGTLTATLSSTLTATLTGTMSSTLTATATTGNTATFTFTATPTYSSTASPTGSATATPTYSFTSSPTASSTATLTHSLTVTDTASSNTPTATRTFTQTPTVTPSWTDTSTATFTRTVTDTITMTGTPVIFTPTVTPTWTGTQTSSSTPTQSSTWTYTSTRTATGTYTQTLTVTDTRTMTATPTMTSTATGTSTITPTPMPSPVNLDITLTTAGDTPAAGALITYTIRIVNNTPYSVNNIAVWDTLPPDMGFVSSTIGPAPSQTGNYLFWDITNDEYGVPFILGPGDEITLEFTARINAVDPSRLPFTNIVMTDYNDPYYTVPIGRHPPLKSDTSFYPIGRPIVFPNPFNLDTDNVVRFENVVPGSLIQVYTISGEAVTAINAGTIKATWDCKNRNGKIVSSGIYYFVIRNLTSGEVRKGKLFIVRGN